MEMFLGILLMFSALTGANLIAIFFFRKIFNPIITDLFIHPQRTASPPSIVMGTRNPTPEGKSSNHPRNQASACFSNPTKRAKPW